MRRPFLVSGLIGGALALAFLAGVFVGALRGGPAPFHALKDAVLDRNGAPARPAETAPDPRALGRVSLFSTFAPEVDVVMVGDSLTEGAIWAEIFPTHRIANRGVWGDTTADVRARLDTITNLGAERAFVMLGVNDLAKDMTVPDILENYGVIIDSLTASGAEVVLHSVLLCALPRCLKRSAQIDTLNAGLKAYADRNGLTFVDLNPAMAAPDTGLLPAFTYDGLHLTGAGYAEWARQIARHLP